MWLWFFFFMLPGFTVSGPRDSSEEEETSYWGWAGAEATEEGWGCSQESQNSGGRKEAAAGTETQEKVKICQSIVFVVTHWAQTVLTLQLGP